MKTEKHNLLLSVAVALALTLSPQAFAQPDKPTGRNSMDLLDMPLEELLEIEVESTASLTKTTRRLTPATVTTITQEQIWSSGARSLDELLDIYVPNLQLIRHHWEADHLGLRGIMNDRDDKYLILVNGRIMNERTHYGAISERDLVMLTDIHHIDIVRGPGSALYGPGAISMVINIITDNAETFEGTEFTTRLGAIEEFYSGEFKHGQKFDNGDGGLFLYGGIGHYVGADQHDAPQIFPWDFPDRAYMSWDPSQEGIDNPARDYEGGTRFKAIAINRDGEAHRNLPPLKLHAQLTRGNWDIWTRYTRGGKQHTIDAGDMMHWPYGWVFWSFPESGESPSTGYQQVTTYVGYEQQLAENFSIDYTFSWDMMDFELIKHSGSKDCIYREDEYYGKVMLRWQPNDRHKFAFGSELSHEEFGLKSPGWPEVHPICRHFGSNMPRWSTNLYSLVGEWQWKHNDQWTSFLGARLDDHTYTDWMFSPRLATIYTPTDKDTLKFMWSRSVRANFAEEMRAQIDAGGGNSDPEILDSAEIRYERRHSENLFFAASLFFHYNLELITHSDGNNVPVGTQKEYGCELEASYRTEKTRLDISHGFTKLYDFDLEEDRTTTS